MRLKRILTLLVLSTFLVGFVFLINVDALTINETDSFTIQIGTHLNGLTRDYEDYVEDEFETRTYSVVHVDENRAEWEMSRIYSFTSNEGGDFTDESEHSFIIDPRDGSYLDGTFDGPLGYLTYYTYDNIWFQIDPNLPEGSSVHILGYDYTVIGQTTVFIDLVNAVDVIEVSIFGVSQTVSDYEYDPDGSFEMVFSERYFFDPTTGYIIMYEWSADCYTSVGNFEWSEVGYITTTSYEIQYNQLATTGRVILYLIMSFAFIGVVVGVIRFTKRSWRNQVDHALGIISGEMKPPKAKPGEVAPSLWNPLSIDYHGLLENLPETGAVTLKSGVFIVLEPDGRIAVVDTKGKRDLGNLVYTSKEESIWLLYRLALGVFAHDSAEYELCMGTFPNLQSYIEPTAEVAASDMHALDVFETLTSKKHDDYTEVSRLMARRKILDYSLGQAPLTPESHLKKLKQILEHRPKSILLVGDDDLLSISLARRGIEVTLLEIDPYTCALIQELTEQENLQITIYQTDLRAPLPVELSGRFDLFVADPDFTIEAFALFLSRGLSQIRQGGIGLINFQNNRSQRYKADYLFERLDVDVRERFKETWTYVIVRNKVAYVTGTGKYRHTNYRTEVALATAPYSSVMFEIRRTPDTKIVLTAEMSLLGPEYAIYDF